MKFYTVDGGEYEVNLTHYFNPNPRPRSKLHITARELILDIFPLVYYVEEVPVVIEKGQPKQFLDFFIPAQKMVIEVNGQQHYEFSPHFHGTVQGFIKQKKRDRAKADWCEINGIKQVTLPYNEDINEWRKRITATKTGIAGGEVGQDS